MMAGILEMVIATSVIFMLVTLSQNIVLFVEYNVRRHVE